MIISSLPTGRSSQCDSFHFLLGLIGFNVPPANFDPMIRLALKYSPQELNRLAYDAMFNPEVDSASSRKSNFEFCRDPILNITCQVLVFDSGDDAPVVNEFLYNVGSASCKDSFSTPFWYNRVAATPPVALTEEYVICTKTVILVVSLSLSQRCTLLIWSHLCRGKMRFSPLWVFLWEMQLYQEH
jgi:hypothetical protein